MRTETSTGTTEYARILVPLDGATLSENALPLARRVANASSSTIFLVRAHLPAIEGADAFYLPPHWEAEIRQDERDYLARMRHQLESQTSARVETELLEGTPGDAISRYARKIDANLIVASTSGRTGLSRAWMGSTADWLVRFAPVPVLLVRPTAGTETARDWSGKHLLVPLDGSERAERIIPQALQLARVGDARITLLRVIPPVVRTFVTYGSPVASVGRDEQRTLDVMRSTKDALERLADRLRQEAAGLQVETEVVASEHTAAAILQRARDASADVVAMCSRGRGASRLLVGSVADKLLRGFDGVLLLLGPVALRELESDWIVGEVEEVASG